MKTRRILTIWLYFVLSLAQFQSFSKESNTPQSAKPPQKTSDNQRKQDLKRILRPDEDVEKIIEGVLKKFKVYAGNSFQEENELRDIGTKLIESLKREGDPDFKLFWLDTPSFEAFTIGLPSQIRPVFISRQTVLSCKNLDELAGIIAHEMGHSRATISGQDASRENAKLAEELLTADIEAMERMNRAGFRPQSYLEFMTRIMSDYNGDFLDSILGRYANPEIRVSNLKLWLVSHKTKIPLESQAVQAIPDLLKKPFDKAKAPSTFWKDMLSGSKNLVKLPLELAKSLHQAIQERSSRLGDYLNSDHYQQLSDIKKREAWDILLEKTRPGAVEAYHGVLNLPTENPIFPKNLVRLRYNPKRDDPILHERFLEYLKAVDLPNNKEISGLELSSQIDIFMSKFYESPGLNSAKEKAVAAKFTQDRKKVLAQINELIGIPTNMSLEEHYEYLKTQYDVSLKSWPFFRKNPLAPIVLADLQQKAYDELFSESSSRESKLIALETLRLRRDLTYSNSDTFKFHSENEGYYLKNLRSLWAFVRENGELHDLTCFLRRYNRGHNFFGNLSQRSLFEMTFDPRLSPVQSLYTYLFYKDIKQDENPEQSKYVKEKVGENIKAFIKDASQRMPNTNNRSDEFLDLAQEIILKHAAELDAEDIQNLLRTSELWSYVGLGYKYEDKQRLIKHSSATKEKLRQYAQDLGVKINKRFLARANRQPLQNREQYAKEFSDRYHSALIERARELGIFTNPSDRFHFALSLSNRGATPSLEKLVLEIINSAPDDCTYCVELLKHGLPAESQNRAELVLRLKQKEWVALPHPLSSKERLNRLANVLSEVDEYLPEESTARALLLEDLSELYELNAKESEIFESAKYSRNLQLESLGLRGLAGLMDMVRSNESWPETLKSGESRPHMRQFAFLNFLIGTAPLPHGFFDEKLRDLSPSLMKNFYDKQDTSIKTLILMSLLEEPRGLLTSKDFAQKVDELLIQDSDKYKNDAKILYSAYMDAIKEHAPYKRQLVIAYVLASKSKTDGTSNPGKVLREILQGHGNMGISFGQKLRQFDLLPEDPFGIELNDLQDQGKKPSRHQGFVRLAQVLGIEKIDEALTIKKKLGDASSKAVYEVHYKDGSTTTHDETTAIKLLWEDFEKENEIDLLILRSTADKLKKTAPKHLRDFGTIVDQVANNLERQADLETDYLHEHKANFLYADRVFEGHQFKVVPMDAQLSRSKEHSHMIVAKGERLKNLQGSEKDAAFRAIALMEGDILLHQQGDESGDIYFESDRHQGNYLYLRGDPQSLDPSSRPQLQVIDYSLMQKIPARHRDMILKTIGYFHGLLEKQIADAPNFIRQDLYAMIKDISGEDKNLQSIVTNTLKDTLRKAAKAQWDAPRSSLAFFTSLKTAGVPIEARYFDYFFALGNYSFYARNSSLGKEHLQQNFAERIRVLLPEQFPALGVLEKCRLYFSKIKK